MDQDTATLVVFGIVALMAICYGLGSGWKR